MYSVSCGAANSIVNTENMETENGMETDDSFEIVSDEEIYEACGKGELHKHFRKKRDNIENTLKFIREGEEYGVCDGNFADILRELRHLEEKLHLWHEVRRKTIMQLKQIAEYLEGVHHQIGMARVVGAGGGVVAGGLTLAGGVMTAFTSGPAVPVLMVGAGLGLASGIAGGAASVTETVLSSKQMKRVEVAIEVDTAATSDLETKLEMVKKNDKLSKAAGLFLTVGGIANGTKGLLNLVRGVNNEQTIVAAIEGFAPMFGESVNKQLAKLLVRTGGRMLSGTVTSVVGGVTMMLDMYHLRNGVKKLAAGGEEGVIQIRQIAEQLELGLEDFLEENYADLD